MLEPILPTMKHVAVLLPALVFAVMLTLLAGRSIAPGELAALAPLAPVVNAASAGPAAVSIPAITPPAPAPAGAAPPTALQLADGARVYRSLCAACHLPDGRGMAGVIPPLATADYLLADPSRAVRIVLQGLSGPVTVNNVNYLGAMPPLGAVLTDRQVADVLTYVLNSWGNQGGTVNVEDVRRARGGTPADPLP